MDCFYNFIRRFFPADLTPDFRPMTFPAFARAVPFHCESNLRYSICALVSDPEEYDAMVHSFLAAGFSADFCEYLYCDNSQKNQLDAYQAYNEFLRSARGRIVILCHQDIVLEYDGLDELERVMAEMDARDPNWALLGNAGGIGTGRIAVHVTHADGQEHNSGYFPVRAQSLDENFIVVKRDANLALSHDLTGFHFYGTDLCQNALVRGLNAWVVDFHLLHKSHGNKSSDFWGAYRSLVHKYSRTHPDGFVQTTCALIPTGSSRWKRQRAIFLQLRAMRKSREGESEVTSDFAGSAHELGPMTYLLHLCIYKVVSLFVNLNKSFQKRRAKFLRLRHLQRSGAQEPSTRTEARQLRRSLGFLGYSSQWVVYRLVAPFFQASRSIRKRIGRTR